jgi:hypothetical protein
MKRLQRSVTPKVKGSNNRKKAVRKLAKLHAKVSNIRQDSIHKLTYYQVKAEIPKPIIGGHMSRPWFCAARIEKTQVTKMGDKL